MPPAIQQSDKGRNGTGTVVAHRHNLLSFSCEQIGIVRTLMGTRAEGQNAIARTPAVRKQRIDLDLRYDAEQVLLGRFMLQRGGGTPKF